MIIIKATIHNGRIDVPAPSGLAEGTRVAVEVRPLSRLKIGIEEAEWRDDAATLEDWEA